jgi:hypothetical protein
LPKASPSLYEQYKKQIEALAVLKLNFDLERRHEYTEANGWHIDSYAVDLPAEPPGPPLPDGSWAATKQVLMEYRFPDPRIVTGIYAPDQPFDKRVMLLRARFLWMNFFFGVRIGGVVDQTVPDEEGPKTVWGFNYQTLEGHFERGQMDFAVTKWLETGRVAFTIHAFSQAAQIRNIFYRIGFRLFGRGLQRRFARSALARVHSLVVEQLALQASAKVQEAHG